MEKESGLMSLYERDYKTFNYLAISVVMILISLLIGISDNIPMILILVTGLILFFYSVLRHWEKAGYYAILISACVVLFLSVWYLKGSLGEDLSMGAGFVSFTGLIGGTIGLVNFARGWSRLLYVSGALLILALPVYLVSLPPPPLPFYVSPLPEWITVGIQLFMVLLLLLTGFKGSKESRITRAVLFTVLLVILFFGLWGLVGPAFVKTGEPMKFTARIYACIDLSVAGMVAYSLRKARG